MRREFIQQRITATELLIVAYEDALAAFAADGGIQSYSLDTGQSKQTVARAQIASIRILLDGLYNRVATLQARLSGASVVVRPAF